MTKAEEEIDKADALVARYVESLLDELTNADLHPLFGVYVFGKLAHVHIRTMGDMPTFEDFTNEEALKMATQVDETLTLLRESIKEAQKINNRTLL